MTYKKLPIQKGIPRVSIPTGKQGKKWDDQLGRQVGEGKGKKGEKEKVTVQSLIKDYEDLSRRRAGQGKEIELTKPQIIATLKVGRYALISAGKNGANPNEANINPNDSRFKKRHNVLKQDLVKKGFVFNKVVGKYGEVEDTFLVMVHDKDDKELVELGKKFKQDSIVLVDSGKQRMVGTYGKRVGRMVQGNGFKAVPKSNDFYTKIHIKDDGEFKYLLNFSKEGMRNFFKSLKRLPTQITKSNIEFTPKELVDEHEELVDILEKEPKKEDKTKELLREQKAELKKYKQGKK